jgi:hypothetical protein
VQLKDGGLGRLRRREANGGQHIFELLAGPSCTDALFRLPNADDLYGTFADRAVVAQFSHASRASATHDQRMRPVIRPPQLVNIAVETRNQHDSHCHPPDAPRSLHDCGTQTVAVIVLAPSTGASGLIPVRPGMAPSPLLLAGGFDARPRRGYQLRSF